MSNEYESAVATATEDAEYQVLFNPDVVRSEVLNAADARQHELEDARRYSPERSPRSPAARHYESLRAQEFEPAPEPEQEVVVPDNSYVMRLWREYQLLPPPLQKGQRMKVVVDLKAYERQGFALTQTYTVDSDYLEMLYERDALIRKKEREKNVKTVSEGFLLLVQGIEWIHTIWNPLGLKLKGLYDTTFAHRDVYDSVLEDLMDKYAASGSRIEPEYKFAFLFLGLIAANHSVQKRVENTMLEGTVVDRAAKNAAFQPVKNWVMRDDQGNSRGPARGPHRAGARGPRGGPPRGPPTANRVPIGGFPQPDAYPRPEEFAEVKEFNNLGDDNRLQEELNEELKSMQTPVSTDAAGKPRRKKGGKAIKV